MTTPATPTTPTTIEPTHECFDDAILWFREVIDPQTAGVDFVESTFRIVHAICIAPTGQPFAHGWVEQRDCLRCYISDPGERPLTDVMVWQAGLVDGRRVYYAVDAADFYRAYGARSVATYRLSEALLNTLTRKHSGPWHPVIKALADREDRDPREVFGNAGVTALVFIIPSDTGITMQGVSL